MDTQIQSKLNNMSTTMKNDFDVVFQDFVTVRSDLSETNQKINNFLTNVFTSFNESMHQQLTQQGIINNLGVQLNTKLNSVSAQINQINSDTLQVLNSNQQTVLQNLSTIYQYISDFNQSQQLNFNKTKQQLSDIENQSDTIQSNVVAKIEGAKLETTQQHSTITGLLNANQVIVQSSFDALSLKVQQLKENVTTNQNLINQSLTNINSNMQLTTSGINLVQSSSTTRFNNVDQTLATFKTDSITKLNSIIGSCATQSSMSNLFSTTQNQISTTQNSMYQNQLYLSNIRIEILNLINSNSQKCSTSYAGSDYIQGKCRCVYNAGGGIATSYNSKCCSRTGHNSRTEGGNSICTLTYNCADGATYQTSEWYSGNYESQCK
ncbi:Hypothetical_protein [Hexamita inflata]|uniref:Hypothetical_protein n=1 Tax=Hexamita inflata TaxID=28002 RepID=A0AA86U9C6_9EUKA|nr:Hypothetical protein HINF_LOCUS31501 [Hexamita inflata]